MTGFPPTRAGLPAGLRPGGRFAQWQPTRPRYVVVDVDGTLIGSDGRATAVVEESAKACVDAGIAVGLATGRMPRACRPLAQQLGLIGPHVVHNGAELWADGRAVRTWPLPPAHTEALLEVCARHDLYAELYVDDGYWVTDLRPEARPHWDLLGAEPFGLLDDADVDRSDIIKATVLLFPADDVDAVIGELTAADLTCGPAHAPLLPHVTFINVTDEQVDKGVAVAAAAEHLGCGLSDVVAVGDGLNDLSMLAVAGTAVAMGQAADQVIAAAHLVVPEVDADGVAHALDAVVSWLA